MSNAGQLSNFQPARSFQPPTTIIRGNDITKYLSCETVSLGPGQPKRPCWTLSTYANTPLAVHQSGRLAAPATIAAYPAEYVKAHLELVTPRNVHNKICAAALRYKPK